MSAVQFVIVMQRVLGHEGGYVNNPADPGGETNWGISKRSYSKVDIKNLTRNQAIAIYYRDFWVKIRGDELTKSTFTDGAAYQLCDAAVNSGPPQAIRFMQRALGVADDGVFGPVSMEALKRMPEWKFLVLFIAERMEFQGKLRNWPSASRGWNARNVANLRFAVEDV